jgi:hypothetical protein
MLPDHSSPEIIPPLDVSYPPSKSHDYLSSRPPVPPDTNESPDIRHTLSNSCLDYEAPSYQSDIFAGRTNDSYPLFNSVTPKAPAWISSTSSATPTSFLHPLISLQEDLSPKKEKLTPKIDTNWRDIPRSIHVSSSRDLSSMIPEPQYVSPSPLSDPATPKAPAWTPSTPRPVNVSPLRRTSSPRIPELHHILSSSQPPAIPKQTVASCSTLPQDEDKHTETVRKPNDDPVFPGAYPIDELEQSGYSQLPFVSKLCSLSFFSWVIELTFGW